ncbi:MAG: hypothetical protein JWP94_157 [Mucilaginibacter sp.]|jgi:hypothetical protein|nr:hypothetical protein [Mucilaginibacter sp.]
MKIKIFCGTFLLLILSVVASFAQTPAGPCGLGDIDNNCPLDTLVVVLASIALVFGAVHLHRKGKKKSFEI